MNQKPSALLLIATGCQHCPAVLQNLSELIKEGRLSSLEVVNIVEAPERARELNVRSVPWVKLGPFELLGMKTRSELEQWIEKAEKPDDMSDYFEELMTSGEIAKVQQLVKESPDNIQALFNIMTNPKSSLSARIGVGAIFEELAGNSILKQNIETLGQLSQHKNAQVRNDACYYLGLSHDKGAEEYLRPRLEDENSDVRDAAEDALDTIENESGDKQ